MSKSRLAELRASARATAPLTKGGQRGVAQRTVADFSAAMEKIAPLKLAQSWDNVGLLAGDPSAPLRRVMLAIDLTAPVVQEAVEKRADLLLTYHLPIFKPLARIIGSGAGMDALVHKCIRGGIAIYSPHTALDAAEGGTNDVLAGLCGLRETEPLEFVDDPKGEECKLVVFVPPKDVEKVAEAVFSAGAGHIGDYSQCSFRIPGEGTFFGGETTQPTIGQRGTLEHVEEIRLESVVPLRRLPAVIAAMRKAHSYEEPAFDIYPLKPRPIRGIGRVGRLPKPMALTALARKLRTATRSSQLQIVGHPGHQVEQVVVVAGSAGSLPFRAALTQRHAIVTGEIRHHDALAFQRAGCTAIGVGHWASERPVLTSLAARLNIMLGISTMISAADSDPFSS